MAKTVNNQQGATKDEILKAIDDFARKVESRFNQIDSRFDENGKKFKSIDESFDEVFETLAFIKDNAVTKEELGNMVTKDEFKSEISQINAKLAKVVTKDYLDDKMSDLRGDLVIMLKKGDEKLKSLVNILKDKKVLKPVDVKRIYALEPFTQ